MKKYCETLRNLREDHDLTQTHVAKERGISQQYYSEYENGKNELPIRHLEKLAELYQVSTDYILHGAKKK